jgi:hypothetical protein
MGIDPRAKKNPEVVIEGNTYEVNNVFISELGYLMLRLYSREKKTYVTHNLGTHDPLKNIFKTAIDEARKKR